jgi:hypothetical protein
MVLLDTITNQPSHSSIFFTGIASAALGSLIGGVVTLLTTLHFKKEDYKYDYKKYILQKRKDAYNEIETILVRLGDKKIDRIKKVRIHTIFTETKTESSPLDCFTKELSNVIGRNRFWITENMHDLLVDLLQFLSSYSSLDEFRNKKHITATELVLLAEANFDKIEIHAREINQQFFIDVKELDNIEKFKKNKIFF